MKMVNNLFRPRGCCLVVKLLPSMSGVPSTAEAKRRKVSKSGNDLRTNVRKARIPTSSVSYVSPPFEGAAEIAELAQFLRPA